MIERDGKEVNGVEERRTTGLTPLFSLTSFSSSLNLERKSSTLVSQAIKFLSVMNHTLELPHASSVVTQIVHMSTFIYDI